MIPLAQRPQPSFSPRDRMVAVAATAVLAAGVAVAAIQPGNLDDDDGDSAAPITTTSTSEPGGDGTTTSTTSPGGPDGPNGDGTTTTTAPSSGLGTNGSGSAGDDDLADTGGAPLLVPGVVLLAGAAVTRRLAR